MHRNGNLSWNLCRTTQTLLQFSRQKKTHELNKCELERCSRVETDQRTDHSLFYTATLYNLEPRHVPFHCSKFSRSVITFMIIVCGFLRIEIQLHLAASRYAASTATAIYSTDLLLPFLCNTIVESRLNSGFDSFLFARGEQIKINDDSYLDKTENDSKSFIVIICVKWRNWQHGTQQMEQRSEFSDLSIN